MLWLGIFLWSSLESAVCHATWKGIVTVQRIIWETVSNMFFFHLCIVDL